MAVKVLIILGILSAACHARPSPEDSEGIMAPKGVCFYSRGEGRCVSHYLCKPDSSGNIEVSHPITPPCQHYNDVCCPKERITEWMPPSPVP